MSRAWTADEIADARAMRERGATFAAIGVHIGRRANAVQRKLTAAPAKQQRRLFSDAERVAAAGLRAAGMTDTEIAANLGRTQPCISRLLGPRPRAAAPVILNPGVPERRSERGELLTRDTVRNAWNDFALPAGHDLTWGEISAERFSHA